MYAVINYIHCARPECNGICQVVFEDGSARKISGSSKGRAFEAACAAATSTPIAIPLWDETADKFYHLCSRALDTRRDLSRAESRLTAAATEHPDEPDALRPAALDLFQCLAESLTALDNARAALEAIRACPEATAYDSNPVSKVVEDVTRRLACVVGIVSLRAGLGGIRVKPDANGVAIDLPAGGAPLKDAQWAARVACQWPTASGSVRWWLDFWASMREMRDHPGFTADEREKLCRVVTAYGSQAVH